MSKTNMLYDIRISFDSKFFSDTKTNKYWFGEKLFLFVE